MSEFARPLLWALIICLSISLVAVVISPPLQNPPYAPKVNSEQQADGALKGQKNSERAVPSTQANEEHGGQHPEQSENEGTEFWPPFLGLRLKITDSLLAGFTFGLLVFTGLLWWSTNKLWAAGERQVDFMMKNAEAQSQDTRASIAVADKAATAAVAQTETIIKAERPYIFLKITEPGITFRDDGTFHFKPKDWFTFQFSNFGKTPAQLIEFYETYPVTDVGAEPIPIDAMKDRGRLLPVGTISGYGDPFTLNTKLSAKQGADQFLTTGAWKTKRLYFQGYLRYADTFGQHYIVGWVMRFFPEHDAWAIRGDERYNYSREEDPKQIPVHPKYT